MAKENEEEIGTYTDYLKELVRDGYLGERGQPLKCRVCNSEDLEDKDLMYGEMGMHGVYEYRSVCKECGNVAGIWSYGQWEL